MPRRLTEGSSTSTQGGRDALSRANRARRAEASLSRLHVSQTRPSPKMSIPRREGTKIAVNAFSRRYLLRSPRSELRAYAHQGSRPVRKSVSVQGEKMTVPASLTSQ